MTNLLYSAKHYQIKSEKSAVRAEDAANRAEEVKDIAVEAVTKLNGIDETVANAKTEITNHANTEQSEAISAINTAENNAITNIINTGGLPVGSILPFGGSTAPSGYLLCNGATISRTTYANLFAKIGTTYGAGDGSTTFALPNYSSARMVTSASIGVKGNGMTLGLYAGKTDDRNPSGLGADGNGNLHAYKNLYGTNVNTSISGNASLSNSLGITTDSTKSGITGTANLASTCKFIIKY